MHTHPDTVTEAFSVLHEEMRRLRRENADWRMQAARNLAQSELLRQEMADLLRQLGQLRGQLQRQSGVVGIVTIGASTTGAPDTINYTKEIPL